MDDEYGPPGGCFDSILILNIFYMSRLDIFRKGISERKEFFFDRDRFVFEEKMNLEGYDVYWYKRYNSIGQMGSEMVIPVKKKQPDGSYVYVYPSTEEFGRYGWFFPPRMTREELIGKMTGILAARNAHKKARKAPNSRDNG